MADAPTTLKFPCPSCSRNLSAGPDLFGYTLGCPSCGATIEVPTPPARPEPAKTEVLLSSPAQIPKSAAGTNDQPSGQISIQSAREWLNKYGVAMIVSLLFAAWTLQSFSSGSGSKQRAGNGDGSEVTNRSETERAENITRQLVRESLKSPSTASFTEFRVIDQNGPFFQTYIGVDAQNGFGAIVRSYFVCAFKLDEGAKYTTHKMTSVIEVGSFDHRMFKGPSVPEQEQMDFQKHCLGWPGYEAKGDQDNGEKGESNPDSKERPQQVLPSTAKLARPGQIGAENAPSEVDSAEGKPAARRDPAGGNEPAPEKPDKREVEAARTMADAELKSARAELEQVTSQIESERARWQEALGMINRLTANKTRPVREGSPQYQQCMDASKTIKEIEQGAQALKGRKTALEARVKELEK